MSAPTVTGRASLYRRLSGLAFLFVIIGLVLLTIALYQKTFTKVVTVTLKADRAGNQLTAPADVKLRGLIVGEVRDVSSNGNGADLKLALKPDDVKLIPKNVQAQLLPKTLFGEKFVSLVIPDDPSAQQVSDGDVIPQDRSSTARETETALNDLLPLLQTLKPQEVSTTLNAVSTALRGRGNQIGQNLEIVDKYLKGINPKVPTIGQDFRGIADFANTLEAARPNLIQVLDNLSFVNRSLVDYQSQLGNFLTSTTTSTNELDRLITDNQNRFIKLAADSRSPLQVFQRYSPEFPCLAKGLDLSNKFVGDSFGGLQPGLHITLEVVKSQGGYVPGQEPAFKSDRGPDCFGLPNPPVPAKDTNFQDGYRDNQPADTTQAPSGSGSASGSSPVPGSPGVGVPGSAASQPSTPALTSQQGQRAVMSSVIAPVMGVAPNDVPDLAYLLFAPVAQGTEVGLK